jgi:hypothetical protein
MTLAYGSYNNVQINTVIVPAEPGKIIRVAKVVVTTWASMKVTFVSDPGPDPLNLTPPLHVSGAGLNLHLGRSYALATGRGKALGFTAAFQLSSAEYGLSVWYEMVS